MVSAPSMLMYHYSPSSLAPNPRHFPVGRKHPAVSCGSALTSHYTPATSPPPATATVHNIRDETRGHRQFHAFSVKCVPFSCDFPFGLLDVRHNMDALKKFDDAYRRNLFDSGYEPASMH